MGHHAQGPGSTVTFCGTDADDIRVPCTTGAMSLSLSGANSSRGTAFAATGAPAIFPKNPRRVSLISPLYQITSPTES